MDELFCEAINKIIFSGREGISLQGLWSHLDSLRSTAAPVDAIALLLFDDVVPLPPLDDNSKLKLVQMLTESSCIKFSCHVNALTDRVLTSDGIQLRQHQPVFGRDVVARCRSDLHAQSQSLILTALPSLRQLALGLHSTLAKHITDARYCIIEAIGQTQRKGVLQVEAASVVGLSPKEIFRHVKYSRERGLLSQARVSTGKEVSNRIRLLRFEPNQTLVTRQLCGTVTSLESQQDLENAHYIQQQLLPAIVSELLPKTTNGVVGLPAGFEACASLNQRPSVSWKEVMQAGVTAGLWTIEQTKRGSFKFDCLQFTAHARAIAAAQTTGAGAPGVNSTAAIASAVAASPGMFSWLTGPCVNVPRLHQWYQIIAESGSKGIFMPDIARGIGVAPRRCYDFQKVANRLLDVVSVTDTMKRAVAARLYTSAHAPTASAKPGAAPASAASGTSSSATMLADSSKRPYVAQPLALLPNLGSNVVKAENLSIANLSLSAPTSGQSAIRPQPPPPPPAAPAQTAGFQLQRVVAEEEKAGTKRHRPPPTYSMTFLKRAERLAGLVAEHKMLRESAAKRLLSTMDQKDAAQQQLSGTNASAASIDRKTFERVVDVLRKQVPPLLVSVTIKVQRISGGIKDEKLLVHPSVDTASPSFSKLAIAAASEPLPEPEVSNGVRLINTFKERGNLSDELHRLKLSRILHGYIEPILLRVWLLHRHITSVAAPTPGSTNAAELVEPAQNAAAATAPSKQFSFRALIDQMPLGLYLQLVGLPPGPTPAEARRPELLSTPISQLSAATQAALLQIKGTNRPTVAALRELLLVLAKLGLINIRQRDSQAAADTSDGEDVEGDDDMDPNDDVDGDADNPRPATNGGSRRFGISGAAVFDIVPQRTVGGRRHTLTSCAGVREFWHDLRAITMHHILAELADRKSVARGTPRVVPSLEQQRRIRLLFTEFPRKAYPALYSKHAWIVAAAPSSMKFDAIAQEYSTALKSWSNDSAVSAVPARSGPFYCDPADVTRIATVMTMSSSLVANVLQPTVFPYAKSALEEFGGSIFLKQREFANHFVARSAAGMNDGPPRLKRLRPPVGAGTTAAGSETHSTLSNRAAKRRTISGSVSFSMNPDIDAARSSIRTPRGKIRRARWSPAQDHLLRQLWQQHIVRHPPPSAPSNRTLENRALFGDDVRAASLLPIPARTYLEAFASQVKASFPDKTDRQIVLRLKSQRNFMNGAESKSDPTGFAAESTVLPPRAVDEVAKSIGVHDKPHLLAALTFLKVILLEPERSYNRETARRLLAHHRLADINTVLEALVAVGWVVRRRSSLNRSLRSYSWSPVFFGQLHTRHIRAYLFRKAQEYQRTYTGYPSTLSALRAAPSLSELSHGLVVQGAEEQDWKSVVPGSASDWAWLSPHAAPALADGVRPARKDERSRAAFRLSGAAAAAADVLGLDIHAAAVPARLHRSSLSPVTINDNAMDVDVDVDDSTGADHPPVHRTASERFLVVPRVRSLPDIPIFTEGAHVAALMRMAAVGSVVLEPDVSSENINRRKRRARDMVTTEAFQQGPQKLARFDEEQAVGSLLKIAVTTVNQPHSSSMTVESGARNTLPAAAEPRTVLNAAPVLEAVKSSGAAGVALEELRDVPALRLLTAATLSAALTHLTQSGAIILVPGYRDERYVACSHAGLFCTSKLDSAVLNSEVVDLSNSQGSDSTHLVAQPDSQSAIDLLSENGFSFSQPHGTADFSPPAAPAPQAEVPIDMASATPLYTWSSLDGTVNRARLYVLQCSLLALLIQSPGLPAGTLATFMPTVTPLEVQKLLDMLVQDGKVTKRTAEHCEPSLFGSSITKIDVYVPTSTAI